MRSGDEKLSRSRWWVESRWQVTAGEEAAAGVRGRGTEHSGRSRWQRQLRREPGPSRPPPQRWRPEWMLVHVQRMRPGGAGRPRGGRKLGRGWPGPRNPCRGPTAGPAAARPAGRTTRPSGLGTWRKPHGPCGRILARKDGARSRPGAGQRRPRRLHPG